MSKPQPWSAQRPANFSARTGANFDVTPDGRRLAVLVDPSGGEEATQHHAVFLENFFDEVRRHVEL